MSERRKAHKHHDAEHQGSPCVPVMLTITLEILGCPRQVDSAAALAVALQHPDVSSDVKIICRLLQVCNSWRTAVQQSAAAQCVISLDVGMELVRLPTLIGFCRWLPRYAGVVGSITLSASVPECSSEEFNAADSIAMFALETAFKDAARARVQSGCDSQQSGTWGLRSFSSNDLVSSSLLAALPAASLTCLTATVAGTGSERPDMEAIGCLVNLQELHFSHAGLHGKFLPCSLQQLSQLTALTSLYLDQLDINSDARLLPQQLQHMTLFYAAGEGSQQPLLDLRHLTQLKQLYIHSPEHLSPESALPDGLQGLRVKHQTSSSAVPACTLAALKHLQRLQISQPVGSIEQLQQFTGHPSLRHLSLESTTFIGALEETGVWQYIPHLDILDIGGLSTSRERLEMLVNNISLATHLTKLRLSLSTLFLEEASEVTYKLLGSMTGLRSLDIKFPCHSSTHSGKHLAGLTALTKLHLGHEPQVYSPVNDTTAVLLAINLSNLQSLSLGCGHPGGFLSTAALPAVGRLTGLQHLSLGPLVAEAARQGLPYLTGLTRLTYLQGFAAAGQDAVDGFWELVGSSRTRLSG